MQQSSLVKDGRKDEVSPLIKATARTKESQEKGWRSVLNVAKRLVKERPDDHLSSMLAELRELDIGRKDPGKYYTIKDTVKNIGEKILTQEGKDKEERFYYPNVQNGKYSLAHVSKIRYLSRHIRPNTTAVVELGAGWGSNLFQIYIAHGATRSKKLIYYGGEYTREGQICSKYIARRDPDLKFRAFAFDYRKPDVTFLRRQKGHILLFTVHSVGQVETIDPDLFRQLREISNPVTVVHFEPVGWQRDKDLLQKRENNDEAFFKKIGKRALSGNIDSVAANAAWWSWRLEYNTNLLRVVDALKDEGSIDLKRIEYDFDATANVLNPATLIHYDFKR